jgi:SAM-dependent methyltransferase
MYDLLARYYDLIHAHLIDDLDFVLDLAAECDGPILELGCGTGRLLLPLVQAGHMVTGVDNEEAMLDRARQHLDKEAAEVRKRATLLLSDSRSLSFPAGTDCFALVLFSYNTLFHFRPEGIRQTLRRIRANVCQDGRLFLDVTNPNLIEEIVTDDHPVLENTFLDPVAGETIIQKSQSWIDFAEQCLHTTWIFETWKQSGQLADHASVEVEYWYQFPHQLEILLQQSGFRLERIMGGYDRSKFDEESERLLVIARPTD